MGNRGYINAELKKVIKRLSPSPILCPIHSTILLYLISPIRYFESGFNYDTSLSPILYPASSILN